MRRTQPNDGQRAAVVRVMRLWMFRTFRQRTDRPRLNAPIPNCVIQRDLSFPLMREFALIFASVSRWLPITSRSVICANTFDVGCSIRIYPIADTRLADSRVRNVKLGFCLDKLALLAVVEKHGDQKGISDSKSSNFPAGFFSAGCDGTGSDPLADFPPSICITSPRISVA